MSNQSQTNDLLREKIAIFLNQEMSLENGLITVTHVDCTNNLKHAKVFFTVLPDNIYGTALAHLKKHTSALGQYLAKNTRLRRIPHLEWRPDEQEKGAIELDNLLQTIHK